MIQQAPVFIVLLPLTAALFCMLVSKFSKRLGSLMVLAAIAGAFFSALSVLCQTLAAGKPVHYWMGGWAPPLGIEFVLDPLNALLAVVIPLFRYWYLFTAGRFLKTRTGCRWAATTHCLPC